MVTGSFTEQTSSPLFPICGQPLVSYGRLIFSGSCFDDIQGFFTDHVDRGNDEIAGEFRKDRSIHHAQSLEYGERENGYPERSSDRCRSDLVGA